MSAYQLLLRAFPSLDEERPRHAWVRAQLKRLPKGSKLLDAGAGECIYKQDCQHLTYTSQDFCQYNGNGDGEGLQRKGWKQPRIDIVCDIEHLPLPSRSFDAVLCTEVLEHVPHPERAIAELARVLKPGGILLVTAPFTSQTHFAPFHFSTGFSSYYYERVLPEHDLRIEELTRAGDYWTVQRTEALRLPHMVKANGRVPLLWILTIPLAAAQVLLLSLINVVSKPSSAQLCNTIMVRATKVKR